MTSENKKQHDSPFERFKKFTEKVISVPKSEIDRREKEYQRERNQIKKRRKL